MSYNGNNQSQAAAEGRLPAVMSGLAMAASLSGTDTTFKRFLVEEVIFDPSELDEERIQALRVKYALSDAAFFKQMPQNTVIGRILNQSGTGLDRYHYLFPFLPQHVMMPIHAGEHIWAFFEQDKAIDYGFWMWRITEPRHVDDLNHTHADRKFHASERPKSTKEKFEGTADSTPGFENGPTYMDKGELTTKQGSSSSSDPDMKAYEKIIKNSDAGKISELESVPRYKKRPGDYVVQGSNNTLISLGTDRTGRTAKFKKESSGGKVVDGTPDKDQKGKSGTIDIVVGRGQTEKTSGKKVNNSLKKEEVSKKIEDEKPSEGDPDFAMDLGRIYLSMKTDPDGNMDINFLDRVEPGVPASIIKTDHMRIVVRKTLKLLVQPTPGAPENECSGIVFKEGNVIFLPSETGVVKLGGDDASMSPLCQPVATNSNGQVSGPPIISTIGSAVGGGAMNGAFATKVLVK
jgi:hypothetical protein